MRWLRLLDRSRKRKLGIKPILSPPAASTLIREESASSNTGMDLKPDLGYNIPSPQRDFGSVSPSPRLESNRNGFVTPRRRESEETPSQPIQTPTLLNARQTNAAASVRKKFFPTS